MFKTFTFNTNDCSKECRQLLGIYGPMHSNKETLKVTVSFHRLRTKEPVSMSYIGGKVLKPGMAMWHEFKVMLSKCIERHEAEQLLDDDCLAMIPQMRAMS